MALIKTGIEPFDDYTSGVLNGRIDACKWVKLAVDRHYQDLDRQRTEDFPYYFEPKACMHYVNFFENDLFHFDGIFAGKNILFEPWQYFTFASPFAWINTTKVQGYPVRRFNESIVIIPKKQGKSIIIAGTMIYMIFMDDYPGAQVYALALNASHVKRLAYRDAVKLVEGNEELKNIFRINKSAADMGIYYDDMNAHIQPITSDAKKTDGPKVHMAANDEIKDWLDFEVYDTIKNGTASDISPLICNITTAGSDMTSLGYEREQFAKDLLEGTKHNDQTFAVIYTIDKEDEDHWDDLSVIKKANPNFGVSVQSSYYESKLDDARQNERKKNDFLTKHLNVWINAMDHYFTMEKWNDIGRANKELKLDDFKGHPCYLFLDLASRKDICPAYLLFRYGTNSQGKKRYVTFGHNFLPNAVVSQDLIGHRADYNAWAEMGLFTLTPGNTTDFEIIKDHIKWVNKNFKLMEVGLDDWAKDQLSQEITQMRIKNGVIGQRVKYLSEPMKDLEAFIINENDEGEHDPRIIHNGDPVLTWAMSNVVAKEDRNENVFPNKEHPNKKIDPAVAVINLMYMEMVEPLPEQAKRRIPKVIKV